MHELSVIVPIIRIGDKAAQEHNIDNVTAMLLTVGGLHDLEDEWTIRYFDRYKAGTRLENAELKIRHVPICYKCSECGETHEYSRMEFIKADSIACRACGSAAMELISGRELQMDGLEFQSAPAEES